MKRVLLDIPAGPACVRQKRKVAVLGPETVTGRSVESLKRLVGLSSLHEKRILSSKVCETHGKGFELYPFPTIQRQNLR